MKQAASGDYGGKLTNHRREHRTKALSPKVFDPLRFGKSRKPTSEPKIADSSDL
jgi:hypothetical protein